MRLPVFLLGLSISSLVVGVVVWASAASIGKGIGWALAAFVIGQLLYLVVVGILARREATQSRDHAADRRKPDPAAKVRTAKLATRQDHQG